MRCKYFLNNERRNDIVHDITLKEIYNAIDSLKINKASGSDKITAEYSNLYKIEWGNILLELYKVAQNDCIPPAWQTGLLTLI